MGEVVDLSIYKSTGRQLPPAICGLEIIEFDPDDLCSLVDQIDPDSAAEANVQTTAMFARLMARSQPDQ